MRKEIHTILKALDNKDQAVLAMEKRTLDVLNNREDLQSFIYAIKEEIRVATFIHGDRQPFYYLYSAVARLKHEENNSAKNDLANAVQGFRISGIVLNEALVEWLFGIIHFESGKIIRSQQACETALRLLESLIGECEKKGAYNQAIVYKKYLKKIEHFTKEINASIKRKVVRKISYPSTQIRIPWIPVYDSVRAGVNGMIWTDPPDKNGISVHTIEIDGHQHTLHPINKAIKSTDVKINLMSSVKYGLAKVRGHSMNASKPIPIEEGDYILFSSMPVNDQDAIVIAGSRLTDHETSMMVKKYKVDEKMLVSETTDTNENYPPIELSDECKILGTVLAVAKIV